MTCCGEDLDGKDFLLQGSSESFVKYKPLYTVTKKFTSNAKLVWET